MKHKNKKYKTDIRRWGTGRWRRGRSFYVKILEVFWFGNTWGSSWSYLRWIECRSIIDSPNCQLRFVVLEISSWGDFFDVTLVSDDDQIQAHDFKFTILVKFSGGLGLWLLDLEWISPSCVGLVCSVLWGWVYQWWAWAWLGHRHQWQGPDLCSHWGRGVGCCAGCRPSPAGQVLRCDWSCSGHYVWLGDRGGHPNDVLCLVKVSNIEVMLRLNLNVMIVEKDFCYYQTLNVIKERSILISN